MKKILVVDDEKDVVDALYPSLVREGYEVFTACTGEEGLHLVKARRPDLMFLELMLPGIQGLEVCRRIRSNPEYADMPIAILTDRNEEVDRLLAFEMGADDYITKPFSVREVIARVRVALKRSDGHPHKSPTARTFSHKDLFIHFDKYEVAIKGRKVELSPTETKLLFFLTKNAGRVYTRDQLIEHVRGDSSCVSPRTVDVHISRLRKVIENNPRKPAYIITVTSAGYKFDESTS